MSTESDREIEQRLARAGRDAQPQSAGWEDLPERLASIRQVADAGRGGDAPWDVDPPAGVGVGVGRRGFSRFGRRRWAIPAGVAAMIATVIGIGFYLGTGTSAVARWEPIRVVRQDVAITVFNEIETEGVPLFMPVGQAIQKEAHALHQAAQTDPISGIANQVFDLELYGDSAARRRGPTVRSGMALVKDRRVVMNLRAGDNVVRFTDVAASIDPTSVRFVSDTDPVGTKVVEQNFEYDLATAEALLKRYIDKPIVCVGKDGGSIEGHLCSYDDGSIVLADGPPDGDGGARQTQTVARRELRILSCSLWEAQPTCQ